MRVLTRRFIMVTRVFYLGFFRKVSLKIKKITNKTVCKINSLLRKLKRGQCALRFVALCHTHFLFCFVCFVCCCCFYRGKGLCIGSLRGKVHGRLLIITNSIN